MRQSETGSLSRKLIFTDVSSLSGRVEDFSSHDSLMLALVFTCFKYYASPLTVFSSVNSSRYPICFLSSTKFLEVVTRDLKREYSTTYQVCTTFRYYTGIALLQHKHQFLIKKVIYR